MRKFRSSLFTDSTGVKDDPLLVACLERDSAHIGPGAAGDHVRKIQTALTRIESANLTPEMGNYGGLTTVAVKKYKDSPKRRLLQAWQTKADEFVGKRTIKFLDDEMFKLEKGPAPPSGTKLSGAALARLSVPLALRKVNAAIAKLSDYETTLSLRLGPIIRIREFDKVTEAALNTHFRLLPFDMNVISTSHRPIKMEDVKHILGHFKKIQSVLMANLTSFKDGSPVGKDGKLVAAAAHLDSKEVIFSSHFRNFTDAEAAKIGENSKAAVLIHEGFHAVDSAKKSGEDSIHISEFNSSYDTQPADKSLFNPSSYAGFAAHVFKGSDPKPRFGLGPGSRGL